MRCQRSIAVIKTVTLVVIAIVALAAGVGVGYFGVGNHQTRTLSSTQYTTTTLTQVSPVTINTTTTLISTSTSIYVVPAGLELQASINATTISPGGKINLVAFVNNTLSRVNNVSAANVWMIRGLPVAVWSVCDFTLPVEFVLLLGNYSLDGLESIGTNETLQYACAEGFTVSYVAFQPDSFGANLTAAYSVSGGNHTMGPERLLANFTASGYWDPINSTEASQFPSPLLNGPGSGFTFPETSPRPQHAFVSGVYTLAVADEWGQVVVLHFTVT